jgi:hypothetical protein
LPEGKGGHAKELGSRLSVNQKWIARRLIKGSPIRESALFAQEKPESAKSAD